jgi:MFS superfamily sulfate permease-like transporter
MPTIAYTFLGTSKQLAIGPEGVVSLLVGDAVTDTPIPDGENFYDVTYQRATLLALMYFITIIIIIITSLLLLCSLNNIRQHHHAHHHHHHYHHHYHFELYH